MFINVDFSSTYHISLSGNRCLCTCLFYSWWLRFHCVLHFLLGMSFRKVICLLIANPGETRNWQERSCCHRCRCCWYGQSERTSYQRCRADCSEDNHDCRAHPTCSRTGGRGAVQTELCADFPGWSRVQMVLRAEPSMAQTFRTFWPGGLRPEVFRVWTHCVRSLSGSSAGKRYLSGGQTRSNPELRQVKGGWEVKLSKQAHTWSCSSKTAHPELSLSRIQARKPWFEGCHYISLSFP